MQRDPASARPFYPEVLALAGHREPMVRAASAWLMGEDNTYEPFCERLRRLLADAEPVVRYNAATALTRFGDASGRPVLREMLGAHVVKAEWSGAALDGTVVDALREGDFARPLGQLALVDVGGGEQERILAPLEGRLARVRIDKGGRLREGEAIAEIAPNPAQVEAALRGLYLVGRVEDLDVIEPYLEPSAEFPTRVGQQARATAAAVRGRAGSG